MSKTDRWVYFFGAGKADGRGDQKDLLGGKGAGLAEMTRIGLPVPAGFTLSTHACEAYNELGKAWPPGLEKQVRQMMSQLEKVCHKKFGSGKDPLLVSVRSGAARSMPGMMETILNLGLNDESVLGLAQAAKNKRFAYDAYRRLIMMYGATAKGIQREHFDRAFDELKRSRTARRLLRSADQKVLDTDVDGEELEALVDRFKEIYREHTGEDFPQDPFVQLSGAIDAVFNSWMAEKAVTYRRVENITGLRGTAVNVCQMVFGNMGDDSGTGVCFTRDPSTGEAVFYGDVLINAQGEDVVAGIRTPMPLAELQRVMPDVYEQLEAVRVMLEVHYKDMQDLEFTVERGKLYMLQCRTGKRSPQAAFKIAVDQATKGLMTAPVARQLVKKKYLPAKYADAATRSIITKADAIQRMNASDLERLFFPVLDPQIPREELAKRRLAEGIGAVPGAACGEIAFNAADAEARASRGAAVILVRRETSPEDVGGMHAAVGILTATGGKTSHAAVVARGWGKCCIVGCESLNIDTAAKRLVLHGRTLREGDFLTLDGGAGAVYEGRFTLVRPKAPAEYETLMGWCDEIRRLRIRANADTPQDAAKAVELGAEGIGLCRTEHMFFESSQPRRLSAMREMILSDNEEDRKHALEKLLPFQRDDFDGIFNAMNGLPVTIRLLDPPLHEFLPAADNREGLQAVADEFAANIRHEVAKLSVWDEERRRQLDAKRVGIAQLARRVEQLHETNPMLGHRGCRLCITFPEILEMQVRAIMEAAVNCTERGIKVLPEIMIPLSIDPKELSILVERTREIAERIMKERGCKMKYAVGTMIETPRAALLADRMARVSEFFSFGTNDLTQMTLGLSRDDAGRFLPDYVDADKTGIFPDDPFQSIDVDGVGHLMRLSVEKGRSARRELKLGVCGEHGGDPKSIRYCDGLGLDYVSCSPLRVPVARLAAAQSAIETGYKPAKRPSRGRTSKPTAAARPNPPVRSKTSSQSRPKDKAPSPTRTKSSNARSARKAKSATKSGGSGGKAKSASRTKTRGRLEPALA